MLRKQYWRVANQLYIKFQGVFNVGTGTMYPKTDLPAFIHYHQSGV